MGIREMTICFTCNETFDRADSEYAFFCGVVCYNRWLATNSPGNLYGKLISCPDCNRHKKIDTLTEMTTENFKNVKSLKQRMKIENRSTFINYLTNEIEIHDIIKGDPEYLARRILLLVDFYMDHVLSINGKEGSTG
jgi:hypothetical protein